MLASISGGAHARSVGADKESAHNLMVDDHRTNVLYTHTKNLV